MKYKTKFWKIGPWNQQSHPHALVYALVANVLYTFFRQGKHQWKTNKQTRGQKFDETFETFLNPHRRSNSSRFSQVFIKWSKTQTGQLIHFFCLRTPLNIKHLGPFHKSTIYDYGSHKLMGKFLDHEPLFQLTVLIIHVKVRPGAVQKQNFLWGCTQCRLQ